MENQKSKCGNFGGFWSPKSKIWQFSANLVEFRGEKGLSLFVPLVQSDFHWLNTLNIRKERYKLDSSDTSKYLNMNRENEVSD